MTKQKQSKHYTIRTPMGQEVQVTRMSREDIEREIVEFEEKYGMTSEEFSRKWSRGELDCGVRDFVAWIGYCHAVSKTTSTV